MIEATDVVGIVGVSTIIGNPPFSQGGRRPLASGSDVHWLWLTLLPGGEKGNADLVAYFFFCGRMHCSRSRGTLGLIATNTLARGDTREVGGRDVSMVAFSSRVRFRAERGHLPAPTSNMPPCGAVPVTCHLER